MSSFLVSIIIPNYNRAHLISETLDSLLAQTYTNWEAIVIDDGSNDNSEEIVTNYSNVDSRIRWIKRNRLPKGAPVCRNIGIEVSKGEFIIFLDSDDLLAPWCLSQRLSFVNKNSNAVFYIFPMILFNERPSDSLILASFQQGDDLSRFITMDYPWTITSPLWKKDFLQKLGGFDETYNLGQDWELHMRALLQSKAYLWCKDCLPDCFYRQHSGLRVGKNISLENLSTRSNNLSSFFEKCNHLKNEYENDFLYSVYWNSILPLLRLKQFEAVESILNNSSIFKGNITVKRHLKNNVRTYQLLSLNPNTILEKIIRNTFILLFLPQIKRRSHNFLKHRLDSTSIELIKERLGVVK